MITLEYIDESHKLWGTFSKLYLEAFPVNERREPDELRKIQDTKGYKLEVIKSDEEFTGFIEIWNFENFIFLEHLAIIPQKRNQGIGHQVLHQLIRNYPDKPILLEAEYPADELSGRRIKFYNRCGFKALNIDYTQPPYYPGKSSVPMMLLSNKTVSSKDTTGYIRIISRNVYKTD
jgi:GNAT superfamily N-acetyltransferase